jgi:glycolate oxidase
MSAESPKSVLPELISILGEQYVLSDPETTKPYLLDETAPPVRPEPARNVVVVKPANAREVSEIMRLANERGIAVFPRGGGTGLCGGAVPSMPGIVMSMERMNKIEIDRDNLMAICEAGVTLRDLAKAAAEFGLAFPPHPGDESAQVGAMVATNAGGSRAIKHGIMRNATKGLEVVLADGEILKLGWKLQKDNTGYNLMNLFIGSEGTLGIITRAAIRLSPKAAATLTMLVPYSDRYDAIRTVPDILTAGVLPMAIEYVQRKEIAIVERHLNLEWPAKEGSVFLLVILDGNNEEEVLAAAEKISEISQKHGGLEPIVAESSAEQDRILTIRSNIYTALKGESYDILDVSLPPPKMADLMDAIDKISEKYGIYIAMYGHAGDGNLHPQLMLRQGVGPETYEKAKDEIYDKATEMGGAITAEHGVGRIRGKFLHYYLSDRQMELMAEIRHIFDPKGLLNPGVLMLAS